MMTREEIHAYVTINKYMPRISQYLEKISLALSIIALSTGFADKDDQNKLKKEK